MPIEIRCDKCQARYVVGDDKAGKTAKCRCGNQIPVPLPAAAQPPPAPPRAPESIFDDGDYLRAQADSLAGDDAEGEIVVPGGVHCPKCRMVTRPGVVCEWCSAPLAPPPPQKPAPGVPGRATAGPTAAPLGQVRVFATIGEAFQLVFANAGVTFGSVALVLACGFVLYMAMLTVLGGLLARAGLGFVPGPRVPLALSLGPAIGSTMLLLPLLALCLYPLLLGPLYVMDGLLARGKSQIAAVFRGYSSFWSIVGVAVLMMVMFGLLGLAGGVLQAIAMRTSRGAGLVVALGAQAIIIWLGVCLALTYQEIVDRRAGAIQALGTSWTATEGHRLSIFALMLVMGLGSAAVVLGTALPLGMALGRGVGHLVLLFFEAPILLIISTVWFAVQMILYRDIRGLEGASL